MTGFVVGGAIFGALGFLFAPQISAALLSEDQRLKLPKFLEEEEKSPEATKQARMQPQGIGCCLWWQAHLLHAMKPPSRATHDCTCCSMKTLPDCMATMLTCECVLVQDLADKIASLNAAIDDVSAQLKAQDTAAQDAVAAAAVVPS